MATSQSIPEPTKQWRIVKGTYSAPFLAGVVESSPTNTLGETEYLYVARDAAYSSLWHWVWSVGLKPNLREQSFKLLTGNPVF